jgi:prevent-host-death family protein
MISLKEKEDHSMVTRTMSSNEAKQNWGQVMAIADEPGTAIVVESHGKPRVAIIPVEDLETFRQLQQAARREQAMRALREIEAAYDGRNDDLTEEEINDLAVRAIREVREELATERRLPINRDAR